MSHLLKYDMESMTTPRNWLSAGSQINDAVLKWSDRSDMATTILVGDACKTINSVAAHKWQSAEILINAEFAFGVDADPSFLPNLSERKNQIDYPVAMGAVFHEAAHAKYTNYDRISLAEETTPFQLLLVRAFEETRIEKHILKDFPKNAPFLRATSMKLILEDLDHAKIGHNGVEVFSHLVLLTLARVTAGSLKKKDVKPIRDAFKAMFDPKTRNKLQTIWVKAQSYSVHTDWTYLAELANEWIEVLRESGESMSSDLQEEFEKELLEILKSLLGEDFEPGEGEGEGEGESEGSSGAGAGLGGLMAALVNEVETSAQEEVNEMAIQELMDERAKAREEAANESKNHQEEASRVFGRGTGPGGTSSFSTLQVERAPSSDERRAAVSLSQQLERAKYRDRQVIKSSSEIPPGRLNSRQMVSAAEQRSRGAEVTARPFARKQRKHTDEPTLSVGTLVDISGSMTYAMEPMASMSWIMSEATKRVQGRCATVYYGNDVFPVLKPGQHLDKVKVYDAADGTERFDRAFKAIDGSLNLLNGDGARLLVVVSDLCYTSHEVEAAKKWFNRCRASGVAVVVIPFGHDDSAKVHLKGVKGVELIPSTKSLKGITAASYEVGAAAVRQLQVVSAGR